MTRRTALMLPLLLLAACHPQAPAPAAVPERVVLVIVAARDLPVGTVLTEADVRSERWLPEAVEGRYTSSVRDVVGVQLTEALSEGAPVVVGSGPRRTIEIIRGTVGDFPLPPKPSRRVIVDPLPRVGG